jgi:HEPN domain-containing protein
MDREEFVREWLRFATVDLESGRYLLGMRPVPVEVICYHAEQCAEKALKRFLVFGGLELRETHDLSLLLRESLMLNAGFQGLRTEVLGLADYAILTRYPPSLDLVLDDAQAAIADADKILRFCEEAIGPPNGNNSIKSANP